MGLADDPGALLLTPPLDFDKRWDFEDGPPIPIIRCRIIEEEGRAGFAFHAACWSLLEKAWAPEPVPCRRLFYACLSLPWSDTASCLIWDHDYGGMVSAEPDTYPWEDLYVSHGLPCVRSDPFVVPEIQLLPHQTPAAADRVPEGAPIATRKGSRNVFTNMPLEIVHCIAALLPTDDYLNARLALRDFYPVFHSKAFWATRFGPSGELDWVFESQTWNGACDWPSLYRRARKVPPVMRNRKRLWRLAQILKRTLRPQWVEPAQDDVAHGMETGPTVPEVTGNITARPSEPFLLECRRLRQRQVVISPDLSHVAFSLVQSGDDVAYICGIRFVLATGRDVPVGYISDQEVMVSVASLTGLRLAAGALGIRAVQCVVGDGASLPWVGCPDSAPHTERLLFTTPITGVKAGFDVSEPHNSFQYYLLSIDVDMRL